MCKFYVTVYGCGQNEGYIYETCDDPNTPRCSIWFEPDETTWATKCLDCVTAEQLKNLEEQKAGGIVSK
jgi:hypothetical protein